jgi:hypothetical protein
MTESELIQVINAGELHQLNQLKASKHDHWIISQQNRAKCNSGRGQEYCEFADKHQNIYNDLNAKYIELLSNLDKKYRTDQFSAVAQETKKYENDLKRAQILSMEQAAKSKMWIRENWIKIVAAIAAIILVFKFAPKKLKS